MNDNKKSFFSFQFALPVSFVFSLLAGILIGYLFITFYQEKNIQNESAIQKSNQALDELNLLVLQNKELINQHSVFEEEVSQLKSTYTASKLVKDNINTYELILGEQEATGPGVEIFIDIELAQYWFIDIINDLYDLEAEGISINDIRITPHSIFLENNEMNQVYLGDRALNRPFIIKVIGNPNILYKGLTATTGIFEKMKHNFPKKKENIKIEIENEVILKNTLQQEEIS